MQQKTIQLRFSTQRGYVYAMETLFQMVEKGSLPIGEVDDEPLVEYRGIMLDSVRHFLSTKAIKRTIEAMPLSKLNYLHWHIVDD